MQIDLSFQFEVFCSSSSLVFGQKVIETFSPCFVSARTSGSENHRIFIVFARPLLAFPMAISRIATKQTQNSVLRKAPLLKYIYFLEK